MTKFAQSWSSFQTRKCQDISEPMYGYKDTKFWNVALAVIVSLGFVEMAVIAYIQRNPQLIWF